MVPARVRPRVRARGTAILLAVLGALAPASPAAAQARDSVVWVWLDASAVDRSAAPVFSARAMDRRARLGIPAFDNDAPVAAAAVRALEDAGLRVRHRSRWLRAVSGEADAAALDRIRALGFVTRVTPVASIGTPVPVPEPSPAAVAEATPPPGFYGGAFAQVNQIGVPLAHDMGFTGAGVVVAMLDTGFEQIHEALVDLTVLAARDFIQGDTVVRDQAGDEAGQDTHGTRVWSVLAGHQPDEFVGVAYGADFLLAKVDLAISEPRADEDRWVAAIEWADSAGADVASSSLGYRCFDGGFCWSPGDLNGDTAPSTIAADEAVRRGVVVVNSAGNRPTVTTLGTPADADSVIAVGAVNASGQLATFSGRGPTADGRIKPELVARGVSTVTVQPGTTGSYVPGNGTSFAAPLIGGAAALVREAWPQLDAAAVRDALLRSGSLQPPNDSMGYGLPNVASAILFPVGIVPTPGAGNGPGGRLGTLAPIFAWDVPLLHPAAGSVRYVVQIARDSLFASIVHQDTAVDQESVQLSRPLRSGEALWWRVVAESSTGVVRTSAAVGPFSMAPWVTLLTLNDPRGQQTTDPTPFLSWNPLPAPPPIGPLEYDVQIVSAQTLEVLQLIASLADTFVVPESLPFNQPFRWRVIVETATGAVDTVVSVAPFVVTSSTAPPRTLLYQNYPNPFPRQGMPSTTVVFDLAEASRVSLSVYDLRGRLVRRLIPDAREGCSGGPLELPAGSYGQNAGDPPCVTTKWDGDADGGDRMPAGIYLIRLTTGRESHTVRTLFRP